MEIAGKRCDAMKGLMELLTKKNPDTDEIMEEDYDDYEEIFINTNALSKV
jgi:hypothetical protein